MADDKTTAEHAAEPNSENSPMLAAHAAAESFDIRLSSTKSATIAEAVLAASGLREKFAEALDLLAHIVSQANVNPVGDGEWIERYNMPVGSIHKAIPFLARFGIVVDVYGAVHRGRNAPPAVDRVTVAPDRETIAKVIDPVAWQGSDLGIVTEFSLRRDSSLASADALLSSGVLGVPADQVRAETLEALANEVAKEQLQRIAKPIEKWLRTQAAEYRKTAERG